MDFFRKRSNFYKQDTRKGRQSLRRTGTQSYESGIECMRTENLLVLAQSPEIFRDCVLIAGRHRQRIRATDLAGLFIVRIPA